VETNFNVRSFGQEAAERTFGGPRDYARLAAAEVADAVLLAAAAPGHLQME
jgi:hypothetical protein